jgi:hypothetical protein
VTWPSASMIGKLAMVGSSVAVAAGGS